MRPSPVVPPHPRLPDPGRDRGRKKWVPTLASRAVGRPPGQGGDGGVPAVRGWTSPLQLRGKCAQRAGLGAEPACCLPCLRCPLCLLLLLPVPAESVQL